ncbi:MAG: hypothetical protein GAK43_02340 [Stenotrophomonas maltophilia]|nr:MAG: hypothetical protein GAK43_02340 [Stenotrophomonas maltophilia]
MHQRLRTLIANDPVRLRILRQVRSLQLPDAWVAAGLVRSAVWDALHGRVPSPLPADIDVIWFDPSEATAARDRALEARLRELEPQLGWSVKNQARMHLRNGDAAYTSASQAMIHWPETATAVALRLDAEDQLEVAAPLGLDDLFAGILRPTPHCAVGQPRHAVFLQRLAQKAWCDTWPGLRRLDR